MNPGLRATIDFLLYDWLRVQALTERARHAEHTRETFDAVLDTCERIAREKYAPFNRLVDTEEPRFDGERVVLPAATHEAWRAYAASGMLSASQDYDVGGMQLPYTIKAAGNAFFAAASVSIGAGMLTVGNANLLMAHGTEAQRRAFAQPELQGRFAGTMCLSEPQAGSSLSDIATRAAPDGDDFESDPLGPRYRLRGNKMWISAGEHELTDNIVHLVLAKIPGADGRLPPGDGLRCMFHMMNEARIGVGMAATMLGMAGYLASLDYARARLQGRMPGPRARTLLSRRCASSSTPTSNACCWRSGCRPPWRAPVPCPRWRRTRRRWRGPSTRWSTPPAAGACRRAATFFITNCPRSGRACRWCARATARAPRCPKTLSEPGGPRTGPPFRGDTA